MGKKVKFIRDVILPAVLVVPLLLLLTGCLYLPWFEQTNSGSGYDFRGAIGPERSRRPIRPGVVRRDFIEHILGKPGFVSADGHATGYAVTTSSHLEAVPLCFIYQPGTTDHVYVVRFIFSPDGSLTRYDVADRATHPTEPTEHERHEAIIFSPTPYAFDVQSQIYDAVQELNRTGPKLESVEQK